MLSRRGHAGADPDDVNNSASSTAPELAVHMQMMDLKERIIPALAVSTNKVVNTSIYGRAMWVRQRVAEESILWPDQFVAFVDQHLFPL
ncbi:hypothetical protein PGQ11_001363 [Apiospora arundinis]|uniref:Uncharacterized protein n=1 Tax=Apiospora arundinis TaxID=335852 RepID=A0ABR2JMP6_9PEZI